jgi:hypothetical protein
MLRLYDDRECLRGRSCAAPKVEIVCGVHWVHDDEPTPRIGAGLHKAP